MFYTGEKNPDFSIVKADIFAILRRHQDKSGRVILAEIEKHFEGNVSRETIHTVLKNLSEYTHDN